MSRPTALPAPFRLRLLDAADSMDAMTEMLHRAYKVHADRGMHFTASWQDAAVTRRRCDAGETLVLDRGDGDRGVVATVTWRAGRADHECTWYRRPGLAIFGQFAVEPALQGLGLGRALLDEAERRAAAAGFTEMALDTAGPAADMIALYERWGYRLVDKVRWREVNYESVVLAKALSR